MGCGADELIDLLMRCVLDPGDKIVDCPPTFTMYAFDAAVNDAQVVTVPRLPGFQLDVPAIRCVLAIKNMDVGLFWLNDHSEVHQQLRHRLRAGALSRSTVQSWCS